MARPKTLEAPAIVRESLNGDVQVTPDVTPVALLSWQTLLDAEPVGETADAFAFATYAPAEQTFGTAKIDGKLRDMSDAGISAFIAQAPAVACQIQTQQKYQPATGKPKPLGKQTLVRRGDMVAPFRADLQRPVV